MFQFTARQKLAYDLLASDATHALLYGGSRSGKTFLIIRAILARALKAENSRHAVLRFRFNHVKASVVLDTLPKAVDLCYPGLAAVSKLNREDWFYKLPNGSEVWFGGLDDKERTEKILGQEYASIFFNECSQIPWASRNMAVTRLAQKTSLKLRAFYDCNPPHDGHWTHKLFIAKRSPDGGQPIAEPENYVSMRMNPEHNSENIPAEYLKELENLPERLRRRFLLGEWGSSADAALWTLELLDQCRAGSDLPEMRRVLVAVDPSGCSGPEDTRSDEIGIVVVGLGTDGKGYVLEDLSGRYGPHEWGKMVAGAYERHAADCVVAETNFGGAMVKEVVQAARPGTPFREVTASRGKVLRAEPVAQLFEQKKVLMAGRFAELEDQLCAMTTAGYVGGRSPDRADAMVWGLSSLFPAIARPEGQFGQPPQVNIGYRALKRKHG